MREDNNNRQRDSIRQLGKYFYQLSVVSYAGIILVEVTGERNIEACKVGLVAMVGFLAMGIILIYWSNNYNK